LRIAKRRRSNFTPDDSLTDIHRKTRPPPRASPRLRQFQHQRSVTPFSENLPIPSVSGHIRSATLNRRPTMTNHTLVTPPEWTTSLTTILGSQTKLSIPSAQPPPRGHPLLLDDGGDNPVTPTHQNQRQNVTPKTQLPALPPRSPLRAPYK
jgi:hypothetical protein